MGYSKISNDPYSYQSIGLNILFSFKIGNAFCVINFTIEIRVFMNFVYVKGFNYITLGDCVLRASSKNKVVVLRNCQLQP